MTKTRTLPPRTKVKSADTWDLTKVFKSDDEWETAFKKWEQQIPGYEKFKGKLGQSSEMLAACLQFDASVDRLAERLGDYAYLKAAEDQADSAYQRMRGRYQHVAVKASEASAYVRPEILSIPQSTMDRFLQSRELADWRLALERILRYRPHTLSKKEEELLAMSGQVAEAPSQFFRQLNDADLRWGFVRNEKGEKVELSHSTYSSLLHSPKRSVREEAFHKFYAGYDLHRNSIAAAYNGSVQKDCFYARARGYQTALDAALFPDNVPQAVYNNLISSVHNHLPAVYKYYDLRRRAMKLKDIHQYDTYVPILAKIQKRTTWDQAVKLVTDAMCPLGDEYCRALADGLGHERWCDRYPNAGKQSGAFSSGSYDGPPYILMNYQPDVLDHVFTLAHEAGHSMHTWFSARNQPFQYYNYVIFVAEVASTFNEQLLLDHMLKRTKKKDERAYLINHAIDEIRSTVVRQTMFAEYEKVTHALVESGEPLTVEALRREYRKLLDLYFGPDFAIDDELELECLRIPHFYRAFYVYKYATGLSAAIALSQKVLAGGQRELDAYLSFLKGGSSKWPLDLLRDAGVDMEKPDPVEAAMTRFGKLVEELDELL
jgi:oligoendopeptidase F